MMRPYSLLLGGLLPVLLTAQAPRLDHGRLDPAWFGAGMVFERTTRVSYLWIRPGLSLQGRSLHARTWEAPAWIVKPRSEKDQAFVQRLEPILLPTLLEGLRGEIGEALPVSLESGDVVLTGRVTDGLAGGVGGLFGGLAGVYFDLKLTDARSGELLVGVHHAIEGETAESIQARYTVWCRTFARVLAERTLPPLKPQPMAPLKVSASNPAVPATPAGATAELEATLRRLEALKRDGLLTEEEFQTLRKQAVSKATSAK